MEVALDSSALTEIFSLPPKDRDAVITGLRTIGRIRITSINIVEAAAHANTSARDDKLAFYAKLTGDLNPIDLPNELLIKTATAHHEGKDTVQLGSPHAMQLLQNPSIITPELLDENAAWNKERHDSFRTMHETIRRTYQEHFAKIPTDRAKSAIDLITYFCERLDSYLDTLIIPAYEYSGSTISRADAKTFMAGCAAWRVFWAARAHALYTRSVQQAGYGDRTNAGITDLESSIYLAFT